MPDATPTTPETDSVASIDVDEIRIRPEQKLLFYRLKITWSSGGVSFREGQALGDDFKPALDSFTLTAPRKKLLGWLASSGREKNLTIA